MNEASMRKIRDLLVPTTDQLLSNVGSGIIFGTVLNPNPITIQVDGRKAIPHNLIVLSPFCIRAEFDNFIPTYKRGGGSGETAYEAHDHDFHVGLWRGLAAGDKVIMVMSSDKQQYYVLHRLDMIFGDMGE